ncbi:GNAT family N-acetyltransferase [Ornithinibacillus contaminans]|uniref:GNAT family N-acetyltransferase n=1 Tax=Ornithinibacillus contaminans TaxID=694055 RepID=UPI00064E01BA|nr:GNAT family N-acetyltransferase [Ornithinibacillus contaminans]
MKINVLEKEAIGEVARFIAQLNNIDESHIGFCGKDPEEIENFMVNELTDVLYNNSFVCAYDQNQLVGVVGFDADLEDSSAEIWGPFIEADKWQIVHELWRELEKLLPANIHSVAVFPNVKNHHAIQFAKELDCLQHEHAQIILTVNRDDQNHWLDEEPIELTQDLHEEMINLHDQEFPNTYYSGQEIISRLNPTRKVFVVTNTEGLTGYIYVEAEPEYGEASIEFFSVNSSERGKGIGKRLLSAALNWLFTIESMEEISLCVDSSNEAAINLYEKVGFKRTHDLFYFTKKR